MKKFLLIFLFFAAFATTADAKRAVRKAVYVILDGIPADVIERLKPPTLMTIAQQGGYSRLYCGGEVGTYSETPTISAVGYANILYSTWACKHNVWNNEPKVNYSYWSLFRIAKEQKRKVTTGLYSSWTDNRTIVIGAERPENGNFRIDDVADGFDLDKERFPNEKDDLHVFHYDEASVAAAVKSLANDAPDFSWVYLWYPDDAGHKWGNGEKMDYYVMEADRQVAQIWDVVQQRAAKANEDWLFIVVTDHGRTDNGHGHGGQSERERTCWMVSNKKANSRFGTPSLSQVDINPTICQYMGWQLPEKVRWGQDGVPFMGKVDIEALRLSRNNNTVTLNWTPLTQKGKVKIYMTCTNNYANGGNDDYKLMGTARVADGTFTCTLTEQDCEGFLKFVVDAPHNHLNIWQKGQKQQ